LTGNRREKSHNISVKRQATHFKLMTRFAASRFQLVT
jgi:hypothetical protein